MENGEAGENWKDCVLGESPCWRDMNKNGDKRINTQKGASNVNGCGFAMFEGNENKWITENISEYERYARNSLHWPMEGPGGCWDNKLWYKIIKNMKYIDNN